MELNMKIYISVDLEGCAGITSWSETNIGDIEYRNAQEEMTLEVVAACEGLIESGVEEIVIKDAHDSGRNILYDMLPDGVKIIRDWSGSPYSMVEGINESYDGAIFLGYHSAASMTGNPLSHTMNTKASKFILNDMVCSEYLLHTYAAAHFDVPVIMISGDNMICNWAKSFNPNITIAPIKEGVGNSIISLNRKDTLKLINRKAKESINKIQECKIELPSFFKANISYKSHVDAFKASYYPGVKRVDSYNVSYDAESIKDLLVTRMFIL
jgi:D-amino peptidase